MQTLSTAGFFLLYAATAAAAAAQFHQHTHAHTHTQAQANQQQQQQQQLQALFVRNIDGPSPHHEQNDDSEQTSDRIPRQSTGLAAIENMDQTVQGILEWLQGKYANSRKARQEAPARQYLPSRTPTTTQKPRPFQTSNNGDSFRAFNGNQGYPYAQPPSPTFNVPETPSPSPSPTPYNPSSSPAPYYPSSTGYNAPSPSPTFNPSSPTFSGPGYEAPSPSPSAGSSPDVPFSSGEPGPSQIPFSPSTGYSSTGMGFPSPSGPGVAPTGPSGPSGPGVFPPSPQGVPVDNNIDSNDPSAHPPHIHEINVQCAKDMMIIEIEFDRPFDGIIYSKGYYNNPACRYVSPNSGQSRYQLTVLLNSCGTQFVDQFSEGKQAYLENVLVLQNEPGIQEVWDTIRSVRCLWEGNLNKALSVALSVGMLSQEIVTFSGDTAVAKLDIQMGRGPFASAANGLVKIGETMTLVVTVEGDPGFNVLVRQCVARDNDPSSGNVVQLTDDRGCVVKPKLMGAFQTTRNPETNTVVAYAFFKAFKFPDVMDLTIECNVELCKTECAPCTDVSQKFEPGRRRRSVDNSTLDLTDPVTVGRRLRVFLPEDIEQTNQSPAMVINVGGPAGSLDSVCLSSSVFLFSSTLLLAILAAACVCCAVLWLRVQHQSLRK